VGPQQRFERTLTNRKAVYMSQTFVAEQANCLGGWCQVGSTVYSDFYNAEADKPRIVVKIVVYSGGKSGRVWTQADLASGAHAQIAQGAIPRAFFI